jgi:transposase
MKAMAWKTMDVQEQRVRFVVEATQKRSSFGALCEAYEISRPTGYLWLQRYRERGVAGIAECSRRPHHSPRRTESDLERKVTELRLRYPDWGARKLQVLLARERAATAAQYHSSHSAPPRFNWGTETWNCGGAALRA